jgi:23S rRNA pseudouridine1911/1915/1917 synthase
MEIKYNLEESSRLDVWLSNEIKRSRSFIQQCYKNNQISVQGKKVKPSYLLSKGDIIIFSLEEKPLEYKPLNLKLDILMEDEYLLVINKPQGLTVHPGSGNKEYTLVNALISYGKELSTIGGFDRPGIVHRLDKDTSGLIIVAKNNLAHEKLAKLFQERQIVKKYLTLVTGYLSLTEDIIKFPINRCKSNYKKMCVDINNGKDAVTEYRVIRALNEKSLLEVVLHTGRTHQIRVHLAYIGHPIIGDALYGKATKGKTQLLHSYFLKFKHPFTNKDIEIKANLPNWAKDLNFTN